MRELKTMKKIFVFAVLGLSFAILSFGQSVIVAESPSNLIVPATKRPVLEMKVVNSGAAQMDLYPGLTTELELIIYNSGTAKASNCELEIISNTNLINLNKTRLFAFDIEPSDTIFQTLIVSVPSDTLTGRGRITFNINEANGYNMFLERLVNFQVLPMPDMDVAITDIAITDQRDIGHFDVFEPVGITLRIQNCSFLNASDVQVQIVPGERTERVQANPNYFLGNLGAGDYKDVVTRLKATMGAQNLNFDVIISFDGRSKTEKIVLNFRTNYKRPEDLSENGCVEIAAESGVSLISDTLLMNYPPKNADKNKFAIIINSGDYAGVDPIKYSGSDAYAFFNFLTDSLGYPRENVAMMNNIFISDVMELKQYQQVKNIRRMCRRLRNNAELTFYLLGHASNDAYNGHLFFLPVSFQPTSSAIRINMVEVFDLLAFWKTDFKLKSLSAFFNLTMVETSKSGNVTDADYTYVTRQSSIPGITTIISSTPFQSGIIDHIDGASYFAHYLMKGVMGAADLNSDGKVYSSELYNYLADEMIGLPRFYWDKYRMVSVPVQFGQDVPIY